MINSQICLSIEPMDDQKICETGKDLFLCKNFYILIERFCNKIFKEDNGFDLFLNRYFNDEGYVDVWRIPHLLLDIYNCNLSCRGKLLDDSEFKSDFIRFLGLFYNYCLSEYKLYLIKECYFNDLRRNMLEIKTNQHLMNLIMDTYARIIENIGIYQRAE
ncbi:MAG: hypothetical protein K6U80_06920 [Firmicutes bacterium]|nr:hypothetical protein [Bacillota bacterium]